MAAYTFTAPPPPPQHATPHHYLSHHTIPPHHLHTTSSHFSTPHATPSAPHSTCATALRTIRFPRPSTAPYSCTMPRLSSVPHAPRASHLHTTSSRFSAHTTCGSRQLMPHASAHGASPYAADAWTQTARSAVAPLSPRSTCATALAPYGFCTIPPHHATPQQRGTYSSRATVPVRSGAVRREPPSGSCHRHRPVQSAPRRLQVSSRCRIVQARTELRRQAAG